MAKIVFTLDNGEQCEMGHAPFDDKQKPFEDERAARIAFKVMFGGNGYQYFTCDGGVIVFTGHIASVRFEG